jgi:hypothetical protein
MTTPAVAVSHDRAWKNPMPQPVTAVQATPETRPALSYSTYTDLCSDGSVSVVFSDTNDSKTSKSAVIL